VAPSLPRESHAVWDDGKESKQKADTAPSFPHRQSESGGKGVGHPGLWRPRLIGLMVIGWLIRPDKSTCEEPHWPCLPSSVPAPHVNVETSRQFPSSESYASRRNHSLPRDPVASLPWLAPIRRRNLVESRRTFSLRHGEADVDASVSVPPLKPHESKSNTHVQATVRLISIIKVLE
jgi:hypothetical protein